LADAAKAMRRMIMGVFSSVTNEAENRIEDSNAKIWGAWIGTFMLLLFGMPTALAPSDLIFG
jgi:hypothetical protein